MSLIDHFRELRRRVGWTLLGYLVCCGICYSQFTFIFQAIAAPLLEQKAHIAPERMIFTHIAEAFITRLKVCLYAGFMLNFPLTAFQLYRFVTPGLYRTERRFFFSTLFAAPVLFVAGMALAYFFIFPLAWEFFLNFQMHGENGITLELEARISEYVTLVLHILLAFGLAFQMPLILILLARAGLVDDVMLRQKRRYAIIIIFIVAALLTPPDIFSQIGLAIPLLLLFELAVIGCKLVTAQEGKHHA